MMRFRRTAVVLAVAAAVATAPAGSALGAEDCTGTALDICVIQGQQQAQLFFTPSEGGHGQLLVDSTGAALVTYFTQSPAATLRGVAGRGTLDVEFSWGANHAVAPDETSATISGTIPLQTNDLGLESIDVALTLTGRVGDSSHRGTGCSVADTGSAGAGRSRLASVDGSVGDYTLSNGASQIRRYDVCLTTKS